MEEGRALLIDPRGEASAEWGYVCELNVALGGGEVVAILPSIEMLSGRLGRTKCGVAAESCPGAMADFSIGLRLCGGVVVIVL